MSEETREFGRIERIGNSFRGHLNRTFDHAPADVWRLLTDASALPQWLASGSIEQRLGGAVHIDFADSGTVIDSTVTAFEAGRLLEYSWSHGNEPTRPLRWELSAQPAATRLDLTVTLPANEDPTKACAGFEGHLEMLAAALEDVPIKFPFDLYLQARRVYQQQVAD